MRRRTFLALPGAAAAKPGGLAADPHRPKYHLMPPANWMNDPNAPILWKGEYHLFYQHNPSAPVWGKMHWGHAVSPDMIHWRHRPIALTPSRGGPDRDGVWSGCAVVQNGVPTLLYTGTKPEVQCLATATRDDLTRWKKESMPVIAGPPDGLAVTGFRDPCVWEENGGWCMALGSGFAGRGGAVLLYRSDDLRKWTYLHPLCTGKFDPTASGGNPVARGEMWECPSFFELDGRYVLFVSTRGTTPWFIGDYRDGRFTAEIEGRLDYGAYYAPISQLDDRKRRIVWGWIQERRSRAAQEAAGWSGVMSLPRVLSIRPDGLLGIAPAAQTRLLRGRVQHFVNLFVPADRPFLLPDVQGDALEFVLEVEPGDALEYGISVYSSHDGAVRTPILHNVANSRLSVGTPRSTQNGNLALAAGEPLQLDIFLDCSVIEVFANRRCCVTERVYSEPPYPMGVMLEARGGPVRVRSLRVYEMKPISPDRMTT